MIDLGMVVAALLAIYGLIVAPFETILVAVVLLALKYIAGKIGPPPGNRAPDMPSLYIAAAVMTAAGVFGGRYASSRPFKVATALVFVIAVFIDLLIAAYLGVIAFAWAEQF